MHRLDDMLLRQTCVSHLEVDERLRDHTDLSGATQREHRVGEDAHEAAMRAAIHERQAAPVQLGGKLAHDVDVRRQASGRRQEHAHRLHARIIWSRISQPAVMRPGRDRLPLIP